MAYATLMSRFFTQSVLVQSRPNAVDGLSTLLIVSGDSSLNGARYMTFADQDEVAAQVALGYVSATASAMTTVAFAQSPRPQTVAVGRQTDPETFATALAAIADAGLVFSLFCIDSHTNTDVTSAAGYAEAGFFVAAFVSNDAGFLTGTRPASWPNTSKNSAIYYHPTATQYPDVAALAIAAGADPDVNCPAFSAPFSSVTTYDLTSAQRTFARANECNVMVPLDTGEASYTDGPALATAGDFLYLAFTKAWLTTRNKQFIAAVYAGFADLDQKFPYDVRGIAAIKGALGNVANTGIAAGYFGPITALPDGYTIAVTLASGSATVVERIGVLDAIETISDTIYLERAA